MSLALGTSFARLNAGSASVKRMFRGSTGVWNADAADWIKRVEANSGSVGTATANAVTTFCNAIDAAGIRDKFYRLNLFCGTGLNACLVPLYRGPSLSGTQYGNDTDTNVGPFVSDDYVETGASGGLQGNGSSKYLNTGLEGSTLSAGDRHCSAYEIISATAGYSPSVTSGSALASQHGLGPWTNVSATAYRTHNAVGGNASATKGVGFWLGSDTSATASVLYKDGVSAASVSGQPAGGSSDTEYRIFGKPGEYSDVTIGGYSIGLSLSSPQVASFYTVMQAFQTALGRNV